MWFHTVTQTSEKEGEYDTGREGVCESNDDDDNGHTWLTALEALTCI